MKTLHAFGFLRRRRFLKRTIIYATVVIAITLLALGFPVHHHGTSTPPPAAPAIEWSMLDVITNLPGCDGLAIDRNTGDRYVSLEDEGRIVRIQPDGNRHTLVDGMTPIWRVSPDDVRQTSGLRSPEGMAIDTNHILYVVEDVPGGRLLCFDLSRRNPAARLDGVEVDLPFEDHVYAWESVDAGPDGQLLLAGSGLEGFRNTGRPDALFGVILYRDAQRQWWQVVQSLIDGFSAACFSPDASYAFFASETCGEVGCIDLRTRTVNMLLADQALHAPECLCGLPDGSVLVGEEAGLVYRYDPLFNTVDMLIDMSAMIETICLDQGKLLVTEDVLGELVILQTPLQPHNKPEMRPPPPFKQESFPLPLPRICPDYLRGVLRMGGYDADAATAPPFPEFARRTSLLAMHATAVALDASACQGDPYRSIQFMVLYPDMFGVDMGRLLGPVSGFAAITASNLMVRTRSFDRRLLHYDIEEGAFDCFNNRTIALPFPVGAHVTPDGVASIHFIGGGETPDFHIIMNMAHPDLSYMACYPLGGAVELYRLSLPPGLGPEQWIAALPCDEPPQWTPLDASAGNTYGASNR